MRQELRELWEERISDLLSAAKLRIRSRLRDISKELESRGLEKLSPSQYRDYADDIAQSALADHWERYAFQVGKLEAYGRANGAYNSSYCRIFAAQWLNRSQLRIDRNLVRRVCGLSDSPAEVYFVPDSVVDNLDDLPRMYVVLKADGLSETDICRKLYGADNSKAWQLLAHVRLLAEQQLSLLAELSGIIRQATADYAESAEQLESVKAAVVSPDNRLPSEFTLPDKQRMTPDQAYDLAQWYIQQNAAGCN